jgi:hypothetical protein
MNDEQIMNNLLCQILDCWYLDVKKLCEIYIENNVDPDLENIKANYWNFDVNTLLYELIREVAEKFIWEYEAEIKEILNLWEYDDFDTYRSYHELYEIFANYMDSHLWFKNQKIQDIFEASDYSV